MGDSKGAESPLAVEKKGRGFPKPLGGAAGRQGGCAVEVGSDLYLELQEIGSHEKYKKHFPRVVEDLEKVGECGKGIGTFGCLNCGNKLPRVETCKKRLCPECSEKLHLNRTRRALEILGPKSNVLKHWSHVVFTVPSDLRVWPWSWEDILSMRKTAKRIVRDIVGSGGLLAVHTFSSENPSKIHPHVHALVYGRRFHSWKKLKDRWRRYLKRRFNYDGEVVVWENWFLGRNEPRTWRRSKKEMIIRARKLRNRVKYVLRLPDPVPSAYWHFEILAGHQSYCYFGFQPRIMDKTEGKLLCEKCNEKMRLIAVRDAQGKVWVNWELYELYIKKFPEKKEEMDEMIGLWTSPFEKKEGGQ